MLHLRNSPVDSNGKIESLLTDSQKAAIINMLREDVPLSLIKENIGIEDADLLYEVIYEFKVSNKGSISYEKFQKSKVRFTYENPNQEVVAAIAKFRERHGPLRILEQGCGNGVFAYRVARLFPDCQIDGIELTTSGVRHANTNYRRPNLRIWQDDGYKVTAEIPYDLVYHVNVLEHVPDKEKYLRASISLLRHGGLLIFQFPTERYWRFWGFPKYLICKILKRPFKIHGYSDTAIDLFLNYFQGIHIVGKSFRHLYLPRRLYYYIPDALLKPFGKLLDKLEGVMKDCDFYDPLMFVVYYVLKTTGEEQTDLDFDSSIEKDDTHYGRQDRIASILLLSCVWVLASILMGWEVLSGRKTFFKQE